MAPIGGAVQQGHGNTAVAVLLRRLNGSPQFLIQQQGLKLLAISRQAALNLNHPALQWLRTANGQGEEIRPMLISNRQQISEALVDQQQGGRTGTLQKRVAGHRGPQQDLGHEPRRNDVLLRPQSQALTNHPNRRIPRMVGLLREHLEHLQLPIRPAGHHIGEGAAPIDPKTPA